MSDNISSQLDTQKLPTKKDGGISFTQTIEENRKYIQKQYSNGLINIDQLKIFEKFSQESLLKYKTDVKEAIKHFNEGREKILRDTGIELSKEKTIADVQLRLYKNYNIDRYTYKNNTIKQFKKGLIDSLVVGNYELVVMLKEHGSEVFSNLFSWDTIKNMFSSLGESFTDVFSGDAYMKGKSIITVILSTMGATALLNLITR